MQKTNLIVLSALCIFLTASIAQARTTKHTSTSGNTNTATTEHLETHQAAAEHHSAGMSYGLGLSSISPIIFPSATGSITGILTLDSVNLVQVFLAIPTTSPSFQFGIAGLIKHTLWGNSDAGFHVGGGLGLGTNGNFSMNIDGVIGVHYALGGSPIMLTLDGGPAITIQSGVGGGALGGGSTQTSFGMGTFSGLLGASVLYMF